MNRFKPVNQRAWWLVLPVLLVQVGDKPTDARLAEIVSIIEEKWPDLGPHAIVTSRPALVIDTVNPATTSKIAISIRMKNTELAQAPTSRNSTRKMTKNKS